VKQDDGSLQTAHSRMQSSREEDRVSATIFRPKPVRRRGLISLNPTDTGQRGSDFSRDWRRRAPQGSMGYFSRDKLQALMRKAKRLTFVSSCFRAFKSLVTSTSSLRHMWGICKDAVMVCAMTRESNNNVGSQANGSDIKLSKVDLLDEINGIFLILLVEVKRARPVAPFDITRLMIGVVAFAIIVTMAHSSSR
jgi:hypothetical protein